MPAYILYLRAILIFLNEREEMTSAGASLCTNCILLVELVVYYAVSLLDVPILIFCKLVNISKNICIILTSRALLRQNISLCR